MLARLFRPIRLLHAAWHRALGRLSFHLGARERARRGFERVLELLGDDFLSYIYLARLAYDDGDILAWRRECLHARRIAPERYAKLRERLELRSRFELYEPVESHDAAARADGAGGRATWHTPIQHGPFDTYPPLPPLSAAVGISPWIDDFSSEAERAAFCGRPPIAAHEIAAVDLDDLARRLTDEDV
jgi:hypothetical protein